ncbi:LuxR C-terminal-related transcriptional regulator [Petroclostridium sp. X23]|uniref:LuxR C-terminal-related transcriptional regulator n=1 Tax=Petroclostridium sp. X23 TaxID=3045146 RepID=UPI0024ADCC77|nr:LuxR C-terminal-related transcriptional regulator [Petroclostridium sp. X23]WHH60930.1 LuxR C-terminal-related transcriptional regulator [Petroclostridium sp. X23]
MSFTNGIKKLNKFNTLKQVLQRSGTFSMSMRLRLFLFLIILVLTMLLGIFVILLVTGAFTAGLKESESLIKNELLHASRNISVQYGQLSAQAVEFSKNLSQSMENTCREQEKYPSDLQNCPELLEKLISNEYERALFSLEKSKSSGVFIILNATVNPNLDNAENSRAGLYIKNMEPNILSSSTPTFVVLRGFPSISRKNSLSLHTQWSMEFDIKEAPYYHLPVKAANNQLLNRPLSRLYYWSPALTLPGTSEEVMLCSVPLIDSSGNVFGVCGFEISAMLFKLSNMPNTNIYNRAFCILSPLSGDILHIEQSMFAGGYSAKNRSANRSSLQVTKSRDSLYSYRWDDGLSFLGFHQPIQLYPEGSAFSDEKWITAIMVPEEDLIRSIAHLNILLSSLLTLIVLVGIMISYILSKEFTKPIAQAIDIIKSQNLSGAPRSSIPEINDLIDFLSTHIEELQQKADQEKISSAILEEFMNNAKTLSPAERLVFNLYTQGYAAKEITEILCLSINTIKTHTKRIYMKLNVTSREELLLYVNMLRDIGKEFE